MWPRQRLCNNQPAVWAAMNSSGCVGTDFHCRALPLGVRSRLWTLKRALNNLAFRMSFIRLAPGTSSPLLLIMEFLVLGFTIFRLGGRTLRARGSRHWGYGAVDLSSGLEFVYPGGINNQTLREAIFAGLTYGIGVVGLYIMFMSTRSAIVPREPARS